MGWFVFEVCLIPINMVSEVPSLTRQHEHAYEHDRVPTYRPIELDGVSDEPATAGA